MEESENMAVENLEIVTYLNFIRDLNETEISQVDIFEWGKDIELTYVGENGEVRATKGPYKLQDDDLLQQTLESKGIPYTNHQLKYDEGYSGYEWHGFSFFLMLAVPILLCLIISKQASTIKTMALALSRREEPKNSEQS